MLNLESGKINFSIRILFETKIFLLNDGLEVCNQIDKIISAEQPDPTKANKFWKIVTNGP